MGCGKLSGTVGIKGDAIRRIHIIRTSESGDARAQYRVSHQVALDLDMNLKVVFTPQSHP